MQRLLWSRLSQQHTDLILQQHLGRRVGAQHTGGPIDKRSLGVVLAITYSTYVRTHNASDVTVNGNADEVTLLEEIDMDGQNMVAGESSREC